MNDDHHVTERQNLLTRLLDAVKQCQVRFGGRTELAADADSRVSCLCSAWEAVLQHGLKPSSKAFQALKQVTEITGLNKVSDVIAEITSKEAEPDYWFYIKEHLTKHEQDRFYTLKHINTDAGRGRAWLRASLNEHSLERYMHMLLESDDLLSNYYDTWAFIRDQERNSMLPNMAAGLGSILFAINIDNSDLNAVRCPTVAVNIPSSNKPVARFEEEPRPVIAGEESPVGSSVGSYDQKKKEKKKKKKYMHVVSFDEDNSGSTVLRSNSTVQYPSVVSDTSQTSQYETEPSIFPLSNTHRPSVSSDTSFDQGSINSTDLDNSDVGSMRPVNSSGEILEIINTSSKSDISHILESTSTDQGMFSNTDVSSAAFALDVVQRGMDYSHRTAGDGGNVSDVKKEVMSSNELKQAVVAMMVRKDDVEEQNRNLQLLLTEEMERCSALRVEIEDMNAKFANQQEKEAAKYQAILKENDLLKNQLRRYVNAVQMLRSEGSQDENNITVDTGLSAEDSNLSLPSVRSNIDYSYEAKEYEQKLIQVAEMHGELMEFNEMLHKQLNWKDAYIRRLQQELVDLRGPLPKDLHTASENLPVDQFDSLSLQSKWLINIWIPSAFLQGISHDNHHVYQVYIRIKDEEWNIYKRYSEFRDLHLLLKKKYPIVSKYNFPPKKAIGKKDEKVVESRRKVLQNYLRNIIDYVSEMEPSLAENVCKAKLTQFIPFFSDKQPEKGDKKKIKKNASTASLQGNKQEQSREAEQNHYDGL